VLAKYLDQPAGERANAKTRIFSVQFQGMLERSIPVRDNRLSLHEEVAETIDGFSEDRRELASSIVRD
jgi:hypothetical protein